MASTSGRRPIGAPSGGVGLCHADRRVTEPFRLLDPEALGDHLDRLYRAAWALCGRREDAEDLVQETYLRVLAKPRRLHGDDDLRYLLSVLRNTFVSRHRTAARRPQTMPVPEDRELPDRRTATRPDAAAEAHEVFAYIAALPDDFRDALVAVDVAGLSYAEAALLLETKEATITSRLHRARARVARGMDPDREGVL
jgi:RNA polymerase sigma-70 factor (ECF subfamily)